VRTLALKIGALVLALGVLVFVVQASRSGAQAVERAARPAPSASASVDAGATGEPSRSNPYGIMGPATKADPHVMRRAVESLTASPPPPKGAP
jgi:hypothetical protein